MGLILSMSLSGSIVMLVIMLIHYLLSRGSLVRWKMLWIKIAMLFFLLPIPLLKEWATGFFRIDRVSEPVYQLKVEGRFWLLENSRLILNHAERTRLWLLGVILVVALCFFVVSILRYFQIKKCANLFLPKGEGSDWGEEIRELRKKLKIRQKIQIYEDCYERGAFTAGIIRPTVIIPAQLEKDRRQIILLHELLHVKKRDNVFKILAAAVICMHWFNPLVFFLSKLYDELCELRCDELVLGYLDSAQKKIYAEEILNQSLKSKGRKRYEVAHFGWGKKITEIRIRNIARKKNFRRWKAEGIFLSFLIAVGCYFPVQAYKTPEVLSVSTLAGEDSRPVPKNITSFGFVEEGSIGTIDPTVDHVEDLRVLYERQFIPAEGDILYNADTNKYKKEECPHLSKEAGEYYDHTKERFGCIFYIYAAQRCTECREVFRKELISEIHYPKCPHGQ